MLYNEFRFSSPTINEEKINLYQGSKNDKSLIKDIINEWNSRVCLSELCKKWKRDRPSNVSIANPLFLLYNVNSLNSHIADMDAIINNYSPQILILTEVGKVALKKPPIFPDYHFIGQKGTNSFGGVAILCHNSIKYKEISKDLNFILIQIETIPEPTLVGAVYVPPGTTPPLHLFTHCKNKKFVIFGDFNAKHSSWNCDINNNSGNIISYWIEQTGNALIILNLTTSRRSKTIIDFGLTHDNSGWTTEVLETGTSDHYPILLQSPYLTDKTNSFRTTNWRVFSFFMNLVYDYWLSLVYNFDEQFFFSYLSSFLTSLWDRCSTYKSVQGNRPPWPPQLVAHARNVNRRRRIYRRNKTRTHLVQFLEAKHIFNEERSRILKEKFERKVEWIKENNNIWKFTRPIFQPYSTPFRGLTLQNEKITEPKKIVEVLADHYEEHFGEPLPNSNNNFHNECLSIYEKISSLTNIPLENISVEEVKKEWSKFKPKKSTDSSDIFAFLLKNLPSPYLNIITILFIRCSSNGEFF